MSVVGIGFGEGTASDLSLFALVCLLGDLLLLLLQVDADQVLE
jgi:hypothetical protein